MSPHHKVIIPKNGPLGDLFIFLKSLMLRHHRDSKNKNLIQNLQFSDDPHFLDWTHRLKFKKIIILSILALTILFTQGCLQNHKSPQPNILLICIDDLRPELKSFGAAYVHSPHIDRLTEEGVAFQRHYVNAPSCGPSRYTLLTGLYGPTSNNALFLRAASIAEGVSVHPSMPEWFKSHGYTTVAVGKVSHHPGGRGGGNWNDSTIIEMPNAWDEQIMPTGQWQHPRGMMHGLANGEIRVQPDKMDVIQSIAGGDDIYPDGIIIKQATSQLEKLSAFNDSPFFLAIGIIKPHLPFGAPSKYLKLYEEVELPPIKCPEKPAGRSTWHQSDEFKQYNRWDKDTNTDSAFVEDLRKHYAACVTYADTQVGKIMRTLKQAGVDKNTIVVLWGDHGWHLGEHGVWGKHTLFEESLRSPLVIRYPGMNPSGVNTDAIVETLDIFPTLCDLAGIEVPSYSQGHSLKPILMSPEMSGHTAIAYTDQASTVRTDKYRMILHKDGYVELYDHTTDKMEIFNLSEQYPHIVDQLTDTLLKNNQVIK